MGHPLKTILTKNVSIIDPNSGDSWSAGARTNCSVGGFLEGPGTLSVDMGEVC